MLNVNELENQIKQALENTIPPALKQCQLESMPVKSDAGDTAAQQYADSFNELCIPQLAKLLANAIDYYVKNITISGTIITVGSMVTQTATINSPSPITNGKVPNSLGIS